MSFLIFLLTGALVYFVWRILDQMPDVVFRLGEIQRDIAELRRSQEREQDPVARPPLPVPQPQSQPPSVGTNNAAL